MKYIDDFLTTKCAPDLLALKLFPNAKEITETAAMYWLVVNELEKYNIKRSDNVVLLETGCGTVPRTAAYFAYRSKWECIAIDPRLNDTQKNWGKRIYTYKVKDDQINPNEFWDSKKIKEAQAVIVISVHGHGNPMWLYKRIAHNHKAVFEMPCCQPPTITEGNFKMDKGILSPKNTIYWTGTDEIFDERYLSVKTKTYEEMC